MQRMEIQGQWSVCSNEDSKGEGYLVRILEGETQDQKVLYLGTRSVQFGMDDE